MEIISISTVRTGRSNSSVFFYSLWILVTILSLILDECWCLRDVRLLIMPSAIERGDSVILLCQYDLEGAPLYSVSWYRGTYEFYRHTPSEIPAIKFFKTNGIYVDETLSNSTQVVLSEVSFSLSGNFSCEVTADAPSFSTRTASSQLTVIDTPETPPILMVERNRYTLGDILRANCTSPPSRLPADITFKINGIKVGVTAIERHDAESPLVTGINSGPRIQWISTPSSTSSSNFLMNGARGGGGSSNVQHQAYSGQQWTTATLSLQLMPMHFAALVNNVHLNSNGIAYTSSESNYYSYSKNNLEVTCIVHITSLDYHRSTNVQLIARLGEPVHERVMSPSRGCTLISTEIKHEIVILSILSVLVTLL